MVNKRGIADVLVSTLSTIVFIAVFVFVVIPIYIAKIFNSVRLTIISSVLFALGKDQIRSAHSEFVATLWMPISFALGALRKVWGNEPDDAKPTEMTVENAVATYFVGVAIILTALLVWYRNDVMDHLGGMLSFTPY